MYSNDGAFSVDMWFTDVDGQQVLHIWQSNISEPDLGTKDPTLNARAVDEKGVDNRHWKRQRVARVGHELVELSTHDSDGIVITVDANVDAIKMGDLRRIARSVQ